MSDRKGRRGCILVRPLYVLIASAFVVVAATVTGVLRSVTISDAIYASDTNIIDAPVVARVHSSNSTPSSIPSSLPNSTCEVVVAHYNEDISWLRGVCQQCSLTLYHKGDLPTTEIRSSLSHRPDATVIHLQNRGREGETWLQHIVRRYDTLADSTIFVQGSLHFADGLDGLPRGVTTPDLEEACALETDNHPGFHPMGNFTVNLRRSRQYVENYAKWVSAPLQRIMQQLYGPDFKPNLIRFHAGAIFSVSKVNVRFHPRSSYKTILERLLSGNERKDHEYSGYMLERLWNIVFDGKHKMNIDEVRNNGNSARVGGSLARRARKKESERL
mmetsp:Transcript_25641/g.56137  ORF Transcript_25641/g.56137 Transcript_25641/m.56137 type:complete len:330 (+) Transcript_25641:89-1078(+)